MIEMAESSNWITQDYTEKELSGMNREEMDQIFEAMYAVIESGETIIFDFTHGLRNIPMQALTIIHYAKALKHISIRGMFYGAFELGRIGKAAHGGDEA